MANRVTGRGNPKNTVLKSITSKLQKIDAEMKNQAATIIKVGSKRQLTSGEIAMSRLIFKDAIDYSKVWIHLGGLIHTKTGNAMTPAGEIYLPKDDYLKTPDYSKATGENRHWFIHEMVHVWQYQMGTSTGWLGIKQLCKGGYTSEVNSVDSDNELEAYDTDLGGRDLNKKFQDFNFEQQGRIIEFWFDACYLQKVNPKRDHHQKSLQLLGYVEKILRDFLLNPQIKFITEIVIMKKIIYSFVAMVLIGCNQQSRDLNTKIINDNLCLFTNESKDYGKDNFLVHFAKIDFSKEYQSEYEKSYSKTDLPISEKNCIAIPLDKLEKI